MKRILALLLVASAGIVMWAKPPAMAAAGAAKKPLRIAMYSGSAEYNSAQSLAKFKLVLEEQLGAQCTLDIVEEKGTKLDGIEHLENADVVILFTRRVGLAPDQLALVKKHVASGKGIVGIRTASHGFQTWLEFDGLILGGSYKGHYKKEMPAKVAIEAKQQEHPVLKEVGAFETTGKIYQNPKLAEDAKLLLTVASAEATEPAAWVRDARAGEHGRVFYTSLGTVGDFEKAQFVKLLVNAVKWVAP